MKSYGSKRELYRDGFLIAVKFVPEFPVRHKGNYEKLFKELSSEYACKYGVISDTIQNIDSVAPNSVGFFLETHDEGATGRIMGPRFVLLPHETGLELFIPLAGVAATAATGYLAMKVVDRLVDKTLDSITSFLKHRWQEIIDPEREYKIDHVEIRTENKGVGLISFNEFRVEQIRCLMNCFHDVESIMDRNTTCFDGKLLEPPKIHPGYGEVNPHSRD